jgi:hypothetical protein
VGEAPDLPNYPKNAAAGRLAVGNAALQKAKPYTGCPFCGPATARHRRLYASDDIVRRSGRRPDAEVRLPQTFFLAKVKLRIVNF